MVKIGSSLVDTTTDALQKEIPRRKKSGPFFVSSRERRRRGTHEKEHLKN